MTWISNYVALPQHAVKSTTEDCCMVTELSRGLSGMSTVHGCSNAHVDISPCNYRYTFRWRQAKRFAYLTCKQDVYGMEMLQLDDQKNGAQDSWSLDTQFEALFLMDTITDHLLLQQLSSNKLIMLQNCSKYRELGAIRCF